MAVIAVGILALVPALVAGAAQAPVGLGTADSFAVLAGSGITNTGPTTITGDVGTFPTPSQTGFGTVTLNGANHGGDAVTQQAKNDLVTAYNVAAGASPTTAVATELGGSTLTPGVYGSPTLGITGTLTLDALGDPNAVFIFKASTTLITASNSAVVVLNGGTACNVFWQVGSSATLGTGSSLIGSVLALTSITAGTSATVQGRLLARNGAVTLDSNTITRTTCAAAAPTTSTTVAAPTTTAPDEGTTTVPDSPTSTTPGSSPSAPLGGSAPGTGGSDGSAVTGGGTTGGGTAITGGGDSATTGGGDSSTTGGGDSSTTGGGAPRLPYTGNGQLLAVIGVLTVGLGVAMQAASSRRSRAARA